MFSCRDCCSVDVYTYPIPFSLKDFRCHANMGPEPSRGQTVPPTGSSQPLPAVRLPVQTLLLSPTLASRPSVPGPWLLPLVKANLVCLLLSCVPRTLIFHLLGCSSIFMLLSPHRLISQPHLCTLKRLTKTSSVATKQPSLPKDEFCCHVRNAKTAAGIFENHVFILPLVLNFVKRPMTEPITRSWHLAEQVFTEENVYLCSYQHSSSLWPRTRKARNIKK